VLEAAVDRAESQLARFEEPEPAQPASGSALLEVHSWRPGDRARSRSMGWEGRMVALERGGRRATLESGGMRVSIDVADLEPAVSAVGSVTSDRSGAGTTAGALTEATTNVETVRLGRARGVASSLDLRGARVDEALEALDRYLEDASLARLGRVLIIHGLGTGALRDAVRGEAAAHPLVTEVRAGERGEGGDGATIVSLG